MSITVYGASDDLIEIEGDIKEEFYVHDEDGGGANLLAFSDGTVLRIQYSASGVWRISPVCGTAEITQAPEDDDANYSDRATVAAARWVVHGTAIAKVTR